MTSKADKLPLETEPVDNNTILKLKPGDQTLTRLTQLIIVVHSRSCSEVPCNCPTRLAAGSVDSLLGKLRAIFNNLGRLHDSNPVAHTKVKEYLKFIREKHAGKAIVPSQAVPLFFC